MEALETRLRTVDQYADALHFNTEQVHFLVSREKVAYQRAGHSNRIESPPYG